MGGRGYNAIDPGQLEHLFCRCVLVAFCALGGRFTGRVMNNTGFLLAMQVQIFNEKRTDG